jgi:hypothetical protein
MCGEIIQKPFVSDKDLRPFNPPQSTAAEVVLPHAHADQYQQRGLPVVWFKVRLVGTGDQTVLPLWSFPRKRESRFVKVFLDPRLRGGDDPRDFTTSP